MKKIFVLSLSFLLCNSLWAQTLYTWNGGTGNWNVESNWSRTGTPTTVPFPNSSVTTGAGAHDVKIPFDKAGGPTVNSN